MYQPPKAIIHEVGLRCQISCFILTPRNTTTSLQHNSAPPHRKTTPLHTQLLLLALSSPLQTTLQHLLTIRRPCRASPPTSRSRAIQRCAGVWACGISWPRVSNLWDRTIRGTYEGGWVVSRYLPCSGRGWTWTSPRRPPWRRNAGPSGGGCIFSLC